MKKNYQIRVMKYIIVLLFFLHLSSMFAKKEDRDIETADVNIHN